MAGDIYSAWTKLGSTTDQGQNLAVGLNKDGRLEAFMIGLDNTFWHCWQVDPSVSKDWSGWNMLGSTTDQGQSLAVGLNKNGGLEVFMVGMDNTIWHNRQNTGHPGGWTGWQLFGRPGKTGQLLAVGENLDGRLEVFLIAMDDSFWHNWEDASQPDGWHGWELLGKPTDKGQYLDVRGENKDGRLEVFLIGMKNNVWYNWRGSGGGSGGWTDWQMLGKSSDKGESLAVAEKPDGRLEVFMVGMDHTIWHNWQLAPSEDWNGWQLLDDSGHKGTKLVAATNKDGRLEVFMVGMDNTIWHNWQVAPSEDWNGWQLLDNSGQIGTSLVASTNKDGRLEVFIVDQNNNILHAWQTSPQVPPAK